MLLAARKKSVSMQNLASSFQSDNSTTNDATNKSSSSNTNFSSGGNDGHGRNFASVRQKQSTYQSSMMRSYSSTNLMMRAPQTELVGCRVVRGPNWKWGRQDGNLIAS